MEECFEDVYTPRLIADMVVGALRTTFVADGEVCSFCLHDERLRLKLTLIVFGDFLKGWKKKRSLGATPRTYEEQRARSAAVSDVVLGVAAACPRVVPRI